MTARRCKGPKCRKSLTGSQRFYCSRTCQQRAYLKRKGLTVKAVPIAGHRPARPAKPRKRTRPREDWKRAYREATAQAEIERNISA